MRASVITSYNAGKLVWGQKNTRASTIAPYFQARLEHLVGLHSKIRLLELPANTLAYHEIELITAVESFIEYAPWGQCYKTIPW